MKKLIGLAILATAATSAHAQQVDVGTGDWHSLPQARVLGNANIGRAVADEVERIGRQQSCSVDGLGTARVNLSIPFVLEFDSSQRVQRIVVKDVGCPELETLLGRVVQRLASFGEYGATQGPGWYRSVLELSID